MGIIIVFMRNGTTVLLFWAAIADVRRLVEPVALFLFKAFANLIALVAGCTLLITDKKLFADVSSLASETVDAEVIRISETAFVPCVGTAMQPDLLGDGGRIFAKDLGDVLERETFIKGFLDVKSIIQSKVLLVTRY